MITRTLRHIGLLVWIAYFVVPADAGGIINGLPVGPIEVTALLALAWLACRAETPRGAALVGLVLVVAATSGALIPGTGGFRARYFANAEASGSPERSTEFRDDTYTRVDRRLDFALGATELPLAFFNDIARFNFHDPAGPRRRWLEFSAAWTGQWWVDAGAHTLYLHAPDATAQLFVDGQRVASVTPETDAAEATVTLGQGWHRLDLNFSSPYGAPRRFSSGWLAGGDRHPFSAANVATARVRPWQATALWLLRLAKTGCDLIVLAWLGWALATSVWRYLAACCRVPRAWTQYAQVLPGLAIAATVEALLHAWPWSRQLMIMRGGDDSMTYEWYSRDILFNGILMNGGAAPGQGEPFYYQALYPYFLAAVHAVFGEDMFGVILLQRLLVAFAVWTMVKISPSRSPVTKCGPAPSPAARCSPPGSTGRLPLIC